MLRAPPGHSSPGRLLRHHDPGLKTCSEQLCAQTRTWEQEMLSCHSRGMLCPAAGDSGAAAGWGPGDPRGCRSQGGGALPGEAEHYPRRRQLGLFLTKVKPGGLREGGSWGRTEEPTLGWGELPRASLSSRVLRTT